MYVEIALPVVEFMRLNYIYGGHNYAGRMLAKTGQQGNVPAFIDFYSRVEVH